MSKAPTHLWVVGGLSLLWNAFGGYDYLMSQTRNMDYLSSMAPGDAEAAQMVAMLDSFPVWMEFFWALGVWGAVAGSVLLLLRKRWAVHAFAISLVGMFVGLIYQAFMIELPAWMAGPQFAIMNIAIVVVGVGLYLYARRMDQKGVLA